MFEVNGGRVAEAITAGGSSRGPADGLDRSADNHYPASCLEVIQARPVEHIAADDCVLFLWATIPMLPQGYWCRAQHELLLIGTRDDIPCPAPGTQWSSVIKAARHGYMAV
jgi:N6-adenosine-specific RNA methylase IME4